MPQRSLDQAPHLRSAMSPYESQRRLADIPPTNPQMVGFPADCRTKLKLPPTDYAANRERERERVAHIATCLEFPKRVLALATGFEFQLTHTIDSPRR